MKTSNLITLGFILSVYVLFTLSIVFCIGELMAFSIVLIVATFDLMKITLKNCEKSLVVTK